MVEGRAALITGGSSGIGLAIARALGEDGYGITVSARRPEKLDAAAQQLRDDGIEVESVPAQMGEEEVVKLVAEAHTNKEIAEILHLSEKTVENHRSNAMRKLGMRDRVELVRYAIRRGLIEP